MSCIIAIATDRGIFMGADSASTAVGDQRGMSQITTRNKKAFKRGSILVGAVGSVRLLNILANLLKWNDILQVANVEKDTETIIQGIVEGIREAAKDRGFTKKDNDQETIFGQVLLAYRARLFEVQADLGVLEPSAGYDAIGSGTDVAMGSLHTTDGADIPPKDRILAALQATAEFTALVRPPFTFERVVYRTRSQTLKTRTTRKAKR